MALPSAYVSNQKFGKTSGADPDFPPDFPPDFSPATGAVERRRNTKASASRNHRMATAELLAVGITNSSKAPSAASFPDVATACPGNTPCGAGLRKVGQGTDEGGATWAV